MAAGGGDVGVELVQLTDDLRHVEGGQVGVLRV